MRDGSIMVIVDGKARVFAAGLDDPKGLTSWKQDLDVADRTRFAQRKYGRSQNTLAMK